jgi:hypothetical protein
MVYPVIVMDYVGVVGFRAEGIVIVLLFIGLFCMFRVEGRTFRLSWV